MKIQLNSEGFVTIYDDAGVSYCQALADFEIDHGQPLPIELPPGMVAALYDTDAEVMVYTDIKGNAFPLEGRVDIPPLKAVVEVAEDLKEIAVARVEAALADARAEVQLEVQAATAPVVNKQMG